MFPSAAYFLAALSVILGRHIGSGALCEDARGLRIFPLIGRKIGESGGRGRCGHRAKSLKLMVCVGGLVDLPLAELRFGQHQISLRGLGIDLERCVRLFFARGKISGKGADKCQVQPRPTPLGTICTACCAASSAFGALRNCV